MNTKISVGILGATGLVGQHYVQLLADHPWFQVTFLAASEGSVAPRYDQAVAGKWQLCSAIPKPISELPVHPVGAIATAKSACHLLFSALSNPSALHYESLYAEAGFPLISNASAHRLAPDVPLVIPEVNPEQTALISFQKKQRGWKGFIVTKPNCSLQSYLLPLSPLHTLFRVRKLFVTTLQSVSGAGYPGLSALDIADNVIPYIAEEEEKSEQEPRKIWGKIDQAGVKPDETLLISAQCNRVSLLEGHLACVSVQFEQPTSREEILMLWEHFQGVPQQFALPSAPSHPILYREEPNRPQPRYDRTASKGMAVTVGRLRPCPLLNWRFVALSNNLQRGAAAGALLIAELLVHQGHI